MKLALTALTLASLAAFTPVSATPAGNRPNRDGARSGQTNEVIRGIHSEVLGPASRPDETLGGNFYGPYTMRSSTDPLPAGVFEVTLKKTGTEWQETFLVGLPKKPLMPAPVLVLFHGYGQTPRKLLELTSYFPEAMDRGWIVVAPLGAHQYNFSIDYAQKNTEKALDWVAKWLPVDPYRFYAVGFSMGGGGAATYAARHLDPKHARFAAVVNHTGTTSILEVYNNSPDPELLESPLMFGGSPTTFPYEYSIASMMDYDRYTETVDAATDLARNLTHVGVKNFCASGDPNTHLVELTSTSHDHLMLRNVPSVFSEGAQNVHKWSTLNETVVLNYLSGFEYQDPAPGAVVRTLADRNGTWFHFDVEQAQPGQFSPFRWTAVAAQNRIYLDEVSNVARITYDPQDLGMNVAVTHEVVFGSTQGNTIEIVLRGYPQPPIDVKRAGVSTGAWFHDPAKDCVVLIESNGASYPKWSVIP